MLTSPHHVVLTVANLEAQCGLWEALGFVRKPIAVVPAAAALALYGHEGETRELVLSRPEHWTGSHPDLTGPNSASLRDPSGDPFLTGKPDRGSLRLVETAEPGPIRLPFAPGPEALDVYVRELASTVLAAEGAAVSVRPLLTLPLGPITMRQQMLMGFDGARCTLVEIERRRPSLLDAHPEAATSEISSLIIVTSDHEVSEAFWLAAGLQKHSDISLDFEAVSTMMGLPRHEPVRMTLLGDGAISPIRLEFLQFVNVTSSDAGPALDMSSAPHGAPSPVFMVDNIEEEAAALCALGATFGGITSYESASGMVGQAVLFDPSGIRFELHLRN
jgi:catechol 2,3-dioxygenase-like lactoylglutathione lyase family enzyme